MCSQGDPLVRCRVIRRCSRPSFQPHASLQDSRATPFKEWGAIMTAILVALALLMASCGGSAGKKFETCPAITHDELFLNRENDGQRVSAKVGQPIVICLQTIGGGHYGAPPISSKVIRFDAAVFPAKQNPGGPTQVYRFTATAEGVAKISIPHTDSNPTVTFTIQVKKR